MCESDAFIQEMALASCKRVYILVTLTSKPLTSKHDINCNFAADCGLFQYWASVKGFVVKVKNELTSTST